MGGCDRCGWCESLESLDSRGYLNRWKKKLGNGQMGKKLCEDIVTHEHGAIDDFLYIFNVFE